MRTRIKPTAVDVQIEIPPLSISGSFVPSRAEQTAAVGAVHRVVLARDRHPLRPDEGSIREAMNSLYTLYATTREVFRTHGPEIAYGRRDGNLSLGLIGMRVLNDILRPCLSRWHPLLEAHEAARPASLGKAVWEQRWEQQAIDCRADLNQVRRSIRAYIKTLGDIAGTPELAESVIAPPPFAAVPRSTPPAGLLPADAKPRTRMVRFALHGLFSWLVSWRAFGWHWANWGRAARGGRFGLFVDGSVLAGTLVYWLFLKINGWLCDKYRLNDNLAFATAHSARFKHFLRCHIDSSGTLMIYTIGLDPVGAGWARRTARHATAARSSTRSRRRPDAPLRLGPKLRRAPAPPE